MRGLERGLCVGVIGGEKWADDLERIEEGDTLLLPK